MKTVMKCLLTLALLIVGFSCEKSDSDPKPKDYERRTLSLITEQLSIDNQVRVLDNGAELYLEGDVASCNLSQNTCFTINGRIIKTENEGEFIIRDGQFMLHAAPTGCNLSGKLEGRGTLQENHFEITANVQSLCGNGAFECNGGTLLLTIKGDNAANQEIRMTLTMEVSGSLHQTSN